MDEILTLLNSLNIPYKLYGHRAVFTNQESGQTDIPEVRESAKNLFLRNQDKSQYYLITLKHDKRADLKAFTQNIGEKKLSFASPEDLKNLLGLTPGSVSPLGLFNDKQKRVEFYLDKDLAAGQRLCVHPNINTATVAINLNDFKRLITHLGREIRLF